MNEGLNKKLAEWAELPLDADDYCFWKFTESLDAIFKWLVPKAVARIMEAFHWEYEDLAYKHLFNLWYEELLKSSERPNSMMFVVYPALALCLAIEKLIEVKK